MKKIKSIAQLRHEKDRLERERVAIEAKLRSNWEGLKVATKPGNIAREALGTVFGAAKEGTKGNKILNAAINIGLSLLAGKLAGKAGEKIVNLFTKSEKSS